MEHLIRVFDEKGQEFQNAYLEAKKKKEEELEI